MANNRMYLRCGRCGAELYLAKYYPSSNNESGWYRTWDVSLFEFMDNHSHWFDEPYPSAMDGPTHFSISYESDEL